MKFQVARVCACSCEECCNCGSRTQGSITECVGDLNTTNSGLYRKALFLSYFTVGYNFLEGIASILAGLLAGSIALFAFGLDSFIESLSGGVMIWRFSKHGRISEEEESKVETKAIKLVAYTFFILGAYVLYKSAKKLYFHDVSEPSWLGIVIALISIIVMPILFYMKYKTGKSIESKSLIADSKQTLTCVLLSITLLIGLGLSYLYGLWWTDPIVGLIIVVFLIKEGYTVLKEEKLGCC